MNERTPGTIAPAIATTGLLGSREMPLSGGPADAA